MGTYTLSPICVLLHGNAGHLLESGMHPPMFSQSPPLVGTVCGVALLYAHYYSLLAR